jgi:thiol:disulfide interchange protein
MPGPPTTLFFGPEQPERKPLRVVGYMAAADFLAHLEMRQASKPRHKQDI